MKNIFYIPALLMLMLSCRTVRHTERTVSVQKDSVAIQDSATNEHTIVTNVYHEKRDTTIRVEQRQADTTFNAADLTPLYNSAGAPVDRQHRFDGKGVHGNVTIRADGTVEVRCVCDSLQMIVTGLERIITEKTDSLTRLRVQKAFASSNDTYTHNSDTLIRQTGGVWAFGILLAAILLIVAIKLSKNKL